MAKYSIGFDFGSLSVRGLIVDINNGKEIASAAFEYPHGIMTEHLPDGTELPANFSLQHPQDYIDGLKFCCHKLIRKSHISPDDVVGLGLASTASTILPIDEDREPLCFRQEFRSNPHAWIKLWKHHGAFNQAEKMAQTAKKNKYKWIEKYGGIISCEWFLPKAIEIAECAPEVYSASASIIEAVDWLAGKITGTACRSEAIASCNCCFNKNTGFPPDAFFKEVSPIAETLISSKLSEPIVPLGKKIGVLNEFGAMLLGLKEGTPVATPIIDSHASVIGSGANKEGDMVYICGTSAVEILLTREECSIPGIHISAQDASIPGFYSLGSGQNCVGDCFSWFINNCVPENYHIEAKTKGCSIPDLLSAMSTEILPGESGLIALDWWNGVRTPLFRFDLTGCIIGLSINTKPEEIWRALLESHAFGVKKSISLFLEAGKKIDRIFAAGGIPKKNPLLMQILADVLQRDIYVCGSDQTSALGAAILGAAASETASLNILIDRMSSSYSAVYTPNPKNKKIYDILYNKYLDIFVLFSSRLKIVTELGDLRNSILEDKLNNKH